MKRLPQGLVPSTLLLTLASLLLAACSQLGYYAHSVAGGLDLLARRRPIDVVVADPDTPPRLARRLLRIRRIRTFASQELGLPQDASYTTYADLEREAAVWTVVATPELSIEPVTWCFLVVGCLDYRGYFREERAERFAHRLAADGHDVFVGGSLAYSTLGWFADPVLSTFVDLPTPELAGLIFHELAHRRLYLVGDTAFNESFATTVELVGVERWLSAAGRPERIHAYRKRRRQEEETTGLLLAARERLAAIYADERPAPWKRRRKRLILGELRRELRERLPPEALSSLNNARLAAVGTYHRWVGAFTRLLAEQGGDLEAYYAAAEALGRLPADKRHAALTRLAGEDGAVEVPVPGALP